MSPTQPPIPRGLGEHIAQGLSAAMVLGPLVYTASVWTELPPKIPLHFGFNGQADRFGDPSDFWFLPLFALVLFVGLTLLECVPHIYNYPFRVTDKNREATYRFGRRMVLGVKTSTTTILAYVMIATLQTAIGRTNGLGAWFVPSIFVSLIVGFAVSWVRFTRISRAG